MTSTSTIGAPQQQAAARTVADVALRSPELVNEVWCRRVLRQTLQLLELQHAMHLHHPPITPESIGIAANGDPVLIPSGQAAEEPGEAADVQALGAVIHFAITRELPPAAPLRGRAPAGYSDSLVSAVDRCISPNPQERPQSIEELRNLLGIVALGPPAGDGAAPLQAHGIDRPYEARPEGVPFRLQRWLMIGGAAAVLLGAGAALVALLHGTANDDTVVLQLPPATAPATSHDARESVVRPLPPQAVPAVVAGTAVPSFQEPAPAAPPPGPTPAVKPTPQPPRRAAAARPASPPPAARQGTTYKLLVEPWGTVYVDGDERGVSPPLKRLTLAPGLHTVRIVNPNYQDHVIKVEAGKAASGRIAHDFNDE